MAALAGFELAITTARAGAARAGATRVGFLPTKTQGTAPGSAGGIYIWARQYPAATTWTRIA